MASRRPVKLHSTVARGGDKVSEVSVPAPRAQAPSPDEFSDFLSEISATVAREVQAEREDADGDQVEHENCG